MRKLSKEQIEENEVAAEAISDLAAKHMDEFLPYDTNYQLREIMTKGK